MRRHELTDESWAVIEPFLAPPRMGRPVRDRRQVVNGILWKLSTGAAWRDLPERYGPWKTVYERFRRWSADGTWDRLLAHVQQHSDAAGAVDWTVVCVDSTTVRAHQHAAGAPKKGQDWPGEALGRSRGGLTTKIHLACDGEGRPLAFTLTAGNVNDCTQFEQVMARIRIQRCGPGRPRTRPERVAADKGYSSTKIRTYLRRRGIKAAIPERIDQINGRIRRGESLCRLDRAAYRRRNVVERCFNKLKHNKALATRYDKRARHYQALVTLACLKLWLP
ncbi:MULTISPECIES: IS5-like element IS1650 family transposase [Streptomyces]|uniref:IS5-like element IS1650 family transposase n=2 Tax=Streptomyces TaxID=1883 RepID=A0ABT4NUC8_9ACTN|nr:MULTISPECIES: IS5-like element IS1650 family transposase [Streptomyces]MCW8123339.1 IS5-like element IS1650 family transposase [Streptomyces anthocyanicus]MCZ4632505.1 IS5-like element IS1650 family transposase [Streptomyces rubrogriseus]MDX2930842.1 IS5-like element IS1650 family transposase [Streptomyces sp. NRRL_B-16638]MDX3323066.1 IS5-like element IS1650 family transposase [Streptomyces sp. ME03-5684b]MDX3404631.1 IS5-like element IS1650 family transposase [Streptomyces sp. ME01-18h]